MEDTRYIRFLQRHGIKPTANRIMILRAIANEENPMSLKELEYMIITIDKSNISRTLALFRKHHIVHDLEDGVEARASFSRKRFVEAFAGKPGIAGDLGHPLRAGDIAKGLRNERGVAVRFLDACFKVGRHLLWGAEMF